MVEGEYANIKIVTSCDFQIANALVKGLQLIGNSRSVARDMQAAVDLIGGDEAVGQYLQTIISNECDVRSVDDIYNAFELDKLGDFKTVIHWNV